MNLSQRILEMYNFSESGMDWDAIERQVKANDTKARDSQDRARATFDPNKHGPEGAPPHPNAKFEPTAGSRSYTGKWVWTDCDGVSHVKWVKNPRHYESLCETLLADYLLSLFEQA